MGLIPKLTLCGIRMKQQTGVSNAQAKHCPTLARSLLECCALVRPSRALLGPGHLLGWTPQAQRARAVVNTGSPANVRASSCQKISHVENKVDDVYMRRRSDTHRACLFAV